METYGIPDKVEELPPEEREAINKETEIERLRAELTKVSKEKKALEKELEKERIRLMASEMLIDLTKSTYHIKVRKNPLPSNRQPVQRSRRNDRQSAEHQLPL